MEAILWKIRTGAQWREVPSDLCPWKTAGSTTKIHMAADAHGNPLCIEVTGGEVHDSKVAPQLIEQIEGEILISR